MSIKKKDQENVHVNILELTMGKSRVNLVGTSPLVIHAVSFKARAELLYPAKKKNAAEKASSMKHEPYEEFVDACYKFTDEDKSPTRLYMPAGSFHSALASASIDVPGAKKAQMGRLTKVTGLDGSARVAVYGVPEIWTTIVRSSDMARTPDIRTLPILRKWACSFEVSYAVSLVEHRSIINLLSAAGIIIGVGDGRPEKGKLSMGCFRVVQDSDEELRFIVKHMGRDQQDKALASPAYYDLETEKLLRWFDQERDRRVAGMSSSTGSPRKSKSEPAPPRKRKNGGTELNV